MHVMKWPIQVIHGDMESRGYDEFNMDSQCVKCGQSEAFMISETGFYNLWGRKNQDYLCHTCCRQVNIRPTEITEYLYHDFQVLNHRCIKCGYDGNPETRKRVVERIACDSMRALWIFRKEYDFIGDHPIYFRLPIDLWGIIYGYVIDVVDLCQNRLGNWHVVIGDRRYNNITPVELQRLHACRKRLREW